MIFDRIISIDWSGGKNKKDTDPVPLAVAMWDAERGCRIELPPKAVQAGAKKERKRDRLWSRSACRDMLRRELALSGHRTLVALDFGFGLPWGSDREVFGVDGWRQMVEKLTGIYDAGQTAMSAALGINNLPHLCGHGPFRFSDNRTDARFYLDRKVSYFRLTELAAPQAISQWYLGAGPKVAFHTLTGLPTLDRLLQQREAGQVSFQVWPHEMLQPTIHTIVESYPAMCPKCPTSVECKSRDERDAWKVLQFLVDANMTGRIGEWFSISRLPFGRVEDVSFEMQVRFEGLIFGLR